MKLLALLLSVLNLTWSPDSSRFAYTSGNDLYVHEVSTGRETRITHDGSDVILNGYASWVYYEEIFGRPSRYKAFWWSPDSRKIAFFRFDQNEVPVFPIYSAAGQDGKLNLTRYPKVGESNPRVKIGIVDVAEAPEKIVWADFDQAGDQYFGTPFWGADSGELFVQWEPRIQNHLRLYRVNAADGSKALVYEEEYKTWLSWIEGMLFSDEGLYMARSFETGWEQIYFLSYDGKVLRRLTEGPNWRVQLLQRNPRNGDVWFIAQRDSRVRSGLYRLDRKGRIKLLTPPEYNVDKAEVAADFKTASVRLSNLRTPQFELIVDASGKAFPSETAATLKREGPIACDGRGRAKRDGF